MDEFERQIFYAYLAGIIDGEGSISDMRTSIAKNGEQLYQVVLQINNTDTKLLDFIEQNAPISPYRYPDRRQKKSYHKQNHKLRWNAGKATKLLEWVENYLILKKPQAELAIKFQNLHDHYERMYGRNKLKPDSYYKEIRKFHDKMRNLNRRGRNIKRF